MYAGRALFSWEGRGATGRLFHEGSPLERTVVAGAADVLAQQVVPGITPRNCHESLLFAITSQYTALERTLRIMEEARSIPLADLRREVVLDELLRRETQYRENRMSPALAALDTYQGGIVAVAEAFLAWPEETRREVVREVPFLGEKTASLWHICLGGTTLMALDVHNLRQLAAIGVPVREDYYNGKVRKSGITAGQVIRVTPRDLAYRKIEAAARRRLQHVPELQEDGQVNMALATALFWWKGVQSIRDNGRAIKFPSLYKE